MPEIHKTNYTPELCAAQLFRGWFASCNCSLIILPAPHNTSLAATFLLSWQRLKAEEATDALAQRLFVACVYCAPNTPVLGHLLAALLPDEGRSDLPPGAGRPPGAVGQELEDAFYQAGSFDPAQWQALAEAFNAAERPHRAEYTIEKLRRLLSIQHHFHPKTNAHPVAKSAVALIPIDAFRSVQSSSPIR